MILWRLREQSEPDSDPGGRSIQCSLEKHPEVYRLFVTYGEDLLVGEAHISMDAARASAETFRRELIAKGWSQG